MLRRLLVAVLLTTSILTTPVVNVSAKDLPVVFEDVTARGRALYESDQAAWHATDAVLALKPADGLVKRYIAHKTTEGWKVGFGRLSAKGDSFLVAFEASQGATPNDFSVKRFDPPVVDDGFYFKAAKAIETAHNDFHGENRAYNVAVLPSQPDGLFVYVLPAQTKDGVFPLGGDVRYSISADGKQITAKRQMHKTILEMTPTPNTAAGFHSHILREEPEDSDVFYVLTRRPSIAEYVAIAGKKKMFTITPDGTILFKK